VTDETVQSLARGLAVLEAFDDEHRAMTLSGVAERTGLSRATARRLLLTLESLGFVRADGRQFSLTPRVLRLGHAYLSSLSLPELAQPVLDRLCVDLGESTSVSVLDGAEVVYVARAEARRIMRVAITVGTRFPAVVASMGRVLLAGLDPAAAHAVVTGTPVHRFTPRTLTDPDALIAEIDRVRSTGWSLVDQELETGLVSLAVPVLAPDGRWDAALNVSLSALAFGEHSPTDLSDRLVPLLRSAADEIAQARRHQR
jgi:IclR family transcriptional regulator, pca regulon regulatory protein